MPNHVTNILSVSGDREKVREMFEAIKSDEIGLGSIDFNKVIPMPEHIFSGNLGMAEREKYGKDNWYDWSISNWGTKWNSYGYDGAYTPQDFDGEHIEFQTAWSRPENVIAALAAKYPDLSFEHKWADEDFGYNTGKKNMKTARKHSATSLPAAPRKRWSWQLRFTKWIWPMRVTCTMRKPANMNIIVQTSRCH